MNKLYLLIIIIIIILLFVLTCGNANNKSMVEHDIKHNTKLFISDKMQDTLLLFLNTIDNIPNFYDFPTNYIIELKDKNILKFRAMPSIYIIFNAKTGKETTWEILRGGCKINSKNVLVYSDFKNISNFINLDYLSIDFAKKIYDFTLSTSDNEDDCSIAKLPPNIEWIYKIHSIDSLELLSKEDYVSDTLFLHH